jgi:hypothetical protein
MINDRPVRIIHVVILAWIQSVQLTEIIDVCDYPNVHLAANFCILLFSESVTYILPEEEPTAIPTGDKRNDTGRYDRFI